MRKYLSALLAGAAAVGGLATMIAGASASTGDVVCTPAPGSTTFIGKLTVAHDLIVPPGIGCGLTQGSTVGHDVIVQKGASFFPGGTTIGHDVRADEAFLIELGDPNNGTTWTTVGHDVIVEKTTGPEPYGNFICQTKIGGNLLIEKSRASVTQWDIGYPDPPNCGRNSVPYDIIGHNAIFRANADSLLVGDNHVGGKIIFTHNTGNPEILSGNTAKKGCMQSHNHAYSGTGNTVLHGKNNCNTGTPTRR